MSVLSPPRHPKVQEALATTRELCKGDIIDGSTVLRHAVGVVVTLERFVPDVSPTLAAGILLHDTPYSVEDQAALDEKLLSFGTETHRIVRAIEREHAYMGNGPGYNADLKNHVEALTSDEPVLLATMADKITAIGSVARRAHAAEDPSTFWAARRGFVNRIPYFEGFQHATAPFVPDSMSVELEKLLATAKSHAISNS